jgi:hypothetical protein
MEIQRSNKVRRTLMLVSLSAYLALGFYLATTRGPSSENSRPAVRVHRQPAPPPPAVIDAPNQPQLEEDINKDFRTVPESFAHIDFQNRSYGSYRLFSGNKIALVLKAGEFEYNNFPPDRGRFSFSDVYYADLTGDRIPEAIVMLSHVQCGGGSCDGGSVVFYIYAVRKGKLQRLWHYETGSYGYGCGLKSFTTQNKQIVLEAFGRCPKPATDYPGTNKFVIEDLTRLVFRFNGKRFVRSKLKFSSAPATDVKNLGPEIRIGHR